MKPTRFLRRLPVAVAALALIAPTTTAVAAPKSVVPEIAWGSCGADLPAFQCATVEVPTDYDRPHGATTTIALTRLPASDPARKIGTLFTNPGGPGGSGVDFVHQLGQTAYQPEVRARFDILGFDPRGVGKSDPVTCFPTAAEEAAAFAGSTPYPVTAAEERAYTKLSLKLAIGCRTTSPDRLAHYSTANVARDMDLLRQAVGDDKLSYVGYSYGTYLGATYARLFPDRIRAFVLDGTLSPEWYSGSDGDRRPIGDRLRQGEGAAETFAQFLAECAKAGPNDCALAKLGDPKTVAESTFQRLKTHPVVLTLPDGSTVTVTYQVAVQVSFFSMYDPAGWPALAESLAQLASASSASETTRAKSAERASELLIEWNRRKEEYASIGTALQPCVEAKQSGRPLAYPQYADAADKVQQFKDLAPNTRLYLDAANYGWGNNSQTTPADMAARLTAVGVANARGFSVNVSNYYTTALSNQYAGWINDNLATRKPFVVDTSRNGNGHNGEWCNPADRKLGVNSQLGGGAEMLLWIKVPGDSDGRCGIKSVDAGTFDPDLAKSLILGDSST